MSEISPVEQIFFTALQKGTPAERAAYLDEACAGQPELRLRVEKLLAAQPQVGAFLEQGMAPGDVTAAFAKEESLIGTVIAGKYKLLESIGEGGMGTVWVAEQTEPVRRKVAIKLIKAGMDSNSVLARFEAERQALAMMDHPNIAKVLDAGMTEERRPYFVMEYIKGLPLTKYCDDVKLSIDERLKLFIQICQAVQHAHQKGIIHRDLKPGNILIALYDGKPVPKVIDFGLAKALHQSLTERTLHTGHEMVLGTPLYMSPEQAELNNLDIDTRSDIYSLGVILYELLTGVTPLEKQRFKEAAWAEVLRIIKDEEPSKPSTKLSHSESLPSVAAQRQMEPKKLSSLLKGDLDWIVMKALAKERDRRYETANGFAMDIQRYLADEPVSAGPPSAGYRLRKFVRRNKGQVIAASLVLLALLAGIAGTSIGLVRANRAAEAEHLAQVEANQQAQKAVAAAEEERKAKHEAEAEKANAQKAAEAEKIAKLDADAKRQEAVRNLAFAKKGNELLGSVFTGLDPKANYATVAELRNALKTNLQKAVKELDGSAIGDPLTVADMQNTLGASLMGLGEAEQAIILFTRARETSSAKLGADHLLTLTSMNNLAEGYRVAGKLDNALPLLEEAFKLIKAKLGTNHSLTLTSLTNLSAGYSNAGKLDKALPLFEEAFKLSKEKLGADHPHTLSCMSNLAQGYQAAGKTDLALPLLEEAFKLNKAILGADHLGTLASMNNLALGYQAAGKLDLAMPLIEETFRLMKERLGVDHPSTLTSMNSLANCYRAAGKLDLALPLFEEAFKLSRNKLGANHPITLASMNNLGAVYQTAGKLDLALPLFEEALKLSRGTFEDDHPDMLKCMGHLARCYWTMNRLDKSVPLLEKLLQLREKKLGRQHPDTQATAGHLGVNYMDAGRLVEALPLMEEAYRSSRHIPTLRWISVELLNGYIQAGKRAEAVPLIGETVAEARQTFPKESPELAGLLAKIGRMLLYIHEFTDAEMLLRESLVIREKKEADAWSTFNTQSLLGSALLGQKKYADAEPLLLKGYEGMKTREKTIPPQGSTRLPEALDRLIQLYTETNKPEEVKKWQAERTKLTKP